jgi:hypothetical protein
MLGNRHVRFAPESAHVQCTTRCLFCANSGHLQRTSRFPLCAKSRHRLLFYHLVSEQLHRVGDREPERLGSSEIDDQLELGWLLDRHVAGLLAPENPGNANAGTAIRVCLARSIAQKAASRDILAFRVA